MLASVAGQNAIRIIAVPQKRSHFKQRTTDERRKYIVVLRRHPYSCLCLAAPQGVGQVPVSYDGDWGGMRHDGPHHTVNSQGCLVPTQECPSYNGGLN